MSEKMKTENNVQTVAENSGSLGVFVQKISNRVLEVYDDLQKISNITEDAKLAVLKSTKVRPRALIRTLEDFKQCCQDENLKSNVQMVINSVEDMLPGGDTTLFVCHNKKDLKTKLEFICVAVRMYDKNACDFCVSTYSYAKSIDKESLAVGVGAMAAGVGFGALACLGISTGGVGFILAGAASAILGIGSAATGAALTVAATDTSLEKNFKDILEASFLHELVSRGHAVLQDGQLFIK